MFNDEADKIIAAVLDADPLVRQFRRDEAARADPTNVERKNDRQLFPPPPDPAAEVARLREEVALRDAAASFGVKPEAVPDFVHRVLTERPRMESRSDPTRPPSLEEYVEDHLRPRAPHLFDARPTRPRGH